MEFSYRDDKPIVPVFVGEKALIELIGIIDTGADYCTLPSDICEKLSFSKIKDIELNIPGGTLVAPLYQGIITIGRAKKEIEIAGLSLPQRLNIDSLIGRNFFGKFDLHLLGKRRKLIIDF